MMLIYPRADLLQLVDLVEATKKILAKESILCKIGKQIDSKRRKLQEKRSARVAIKAITAYGQLDMVIQRFDWLLIWII